MLLVVQSNRCDLPDDTAILVDGVMVTCGRD